jgi:glycosyltransferase involved in cell wall biosynthesis
MFISVVVPALNEEKYVGKCLSSLRAQSYPRELYEIIVVDNASTDRTAEIARGFGVKVVYESQRGETSRG